MTKANLKRLDEGKLYYSISEVCSMTGLEQHVLRYWETEFPQLRPKKNRSGNRAYRNKEIKIIRYIKYLLYEELFTIPGAKKKMADANMADLDGQLSLIRLAPDYSGQRPLAPAASVEAAKPPVPASPNGGPADEDSDGNGAGIVAEGDTHKLRGEILRLKEELEALLSVLGGRGRAVP
jgi:DNA-binding transcriptional MerR regulator